MRKSRAKNADLIASFPKAFVRKSLTCRIKEADIIMYIPKPIVILEKPFIPILL